MSSHANKLSVEGDPAAKKSVLRNQKSKTKYKKQLLNLQYSNRNSMRKEENHVNRFKETKNRSEMLSHEGKMRKHTSARGKSKMHE
jgi:hypothetical protein